MKKLLVVVALMGAVSFASAQEKKNTFVKEGDLIKATLYYDNGQVSQEGYYTADNKLQGTWISYNKEGEKTAVANYDNGKKTGKWFFWNDDTLREVDYSQSRITGVNVWKIDGERVVSND